MVMITKGSADYRKAQKLANAIFDAANSGKEYGELRWYEFRDFMEEVVESIIKVNGFAAEVAKTVQSTIRDWGFGYQVAKCSSKQAWILACAAVENGIEL